LDRGRRKIDLETIAKKILECKTSEAAASLLDELVDQHGGKFRPLGDIPGNHGAVEVGGDSDSASIERGTNAIDATLDLAAERASALKSCRSPREFVEKCYAIPGGQLANEKNEGKLEKLADEVGITISYQYGDKPKTMTLDVRDNGIGIAPEKMPGTILSLHGTNKIEKWYLVGQFGQGGAVTLRFSEFSIIATRKAILADGEPDSVGFTILRYVEPRGNERFGSYSYLVGPNNLPFSVPADGLEFPPGTLVRHINYQVSFASSMVPASAYAVLHAKLFDPLLPLWMRFTTPSGAGGKDGGKTENRRIFGNRRRLMRSGYVEASDERETELEGDPHFGKIVVRYWVLKAEVDRSTKSNFCDPNYPIHITHFGQTHALMPKGLLKDDCKLPFSYDHIILQVDCDGVTFDGRRKLFTANREAMTSEGKAMVREAIVKCLLEDPILRDLEEERREKQFEKGLEQSSEELRKRLAEMLDRIRPGKFVIRVPTEGDGKGKPRRKKGGQGRQRGPGHPLQPDYPTYAKIASYGDPLKFYIGSGRTVLLETDAPDGFLAKAGAKARLELGSEAGKVLSLSSRDTDFVKGWMRITLETDQKAADADEFEFKVILSFEKGDQDVVLEASRPGLIVKESGTGGEKEVKVDAPLVVPVKEDMTQWRELEWDYTDVAEVKGNGGASIIYVSLENEWLKGALSRSRWSKSHVDYIKTRYILQVAFHAFLLHEGILPREDGASEEYAKLLENETLVERLRKAELVRAVRSILTTLTTKGAMDESAELELHEDA
jgi:hypothetical protein